MLRPNGSGKNERQAQIQTDINLNHKKEQTSKAIFVRLYLPVFEMDSRDFESLWPYRYLSKISNQSWTYTHNNKTKQKKKGRERGKKRTVLDSSLDSVYIRVHYPSPLLLHQMLSLLLGQNSLTILAFSEPHISSKNKQTKKPDNITKSQTLFCLSDLG